MSDQPALPQNKDLQDAIAAIGDGITMHGGEQYMTNSAGRLVPVKLMAPANVLEDQTVRGIIAHAEALNAQIDRFRGHTFDDFTSFLDLLHEKYGVHRGGGKGNVTLTTVDGRFKVQVQVQDQLTFGPELQVAKTLVDGCITAWTEGASAEIRALVVHAFQTDQQGRINRSALFALRRLNIEDEQWQRAMKALGDAIRVIGSKQYVRFYRRDAAHQEWRAITVDLAKAGS